MVDALFEEGSEIIPTSVGCKHTGFQSVVLNVPVAFLPLFSVNSLGFNSDIKFPEQDIITEGAAARPSK